MRRNGPAPGLRLRGRGQSPTNRPAKRPAIVTLALLVSIPAVALFGRVGEPAQAAHCAIVPVVRGAMLVDQGLGSYANNPLIRGHDTLIKVTLSQPQTRPSCAATTASAFLTGGTLTVTSGGTNLTTTPIQPTGLPASTFPLIAPYATTPPINSTGDPIFRIPASALAAPAITGRYTATFTANITYESKSSSTAPAIAGHGPVSATRNVTVEAPTNGWKLLVIPMGVPGQPGQFSDGALGAVASGMQTLARLSGVPKGTASGTAALGESTGGVRYTVNQGDLVDVKGLLVDAAGGATSDVVNGKFCGKATNFASIEAQLGQFLQVWNLANRVLAADKAVGVSDELRSRGGAGCAEGMARVGSNSAWVRAMHAPGSPARTGALLGMEGMHMLGGVPLARDDNFSPNHSAKTPADGAVGDANTGFDVASGLFLSDDRSVMKLSSQTAWLDANTLYEPADLQYSLCAFGGTATTECKTAVPTPLGATPSAADLIASFVMSGTTADTEPTTHLVESYATSMLPGTLDADGPYFLEYRNAAGNPIVPRFGVPVFEVQSHHDEDTGDSGTPTDKVFSGAIPFPAAAQAATETIVFYKQTGPTTRVTLFSLDQDGEAPEIVEAPTTTGGGGGVDIDTGTTTLASAADQDEADEPSVAPAISADGRFVVFHSTADNLISNHGGDLFVRELETGELEGVDVPLTEGSGGGANPSISGDGRYVVFQSGSNDLVEGDTNGQVDIFMRDLQEDTTTRVSVTDTGAQLDADSFFPDISDDGSRVAFYSPFVQGNDTNGTHDVYVKGLPGALFRASRTSTGAAGNGGSRFPSLSEDGNYVAFESEASDLVSGDTNDATDIYVRRLSDGTNIRASFLEDVDGDIQGDGESRRAAISANGAFVAFESDATNFSDLDDNELTDVYVRQILEGDTLELVSKAPADSPGASAGTAANADSFTFGPSSISADGQLVAFGSDATDIVGGDTNEEPDAFVRDRERRETLRVSVSDDEGQASGRSGPGPEVLGPISISGNRTAFVSDASDLVPFETSGIHQVFVRVEAPPAEACVIDQEASTVSATTSEIEFVNETSRIVDVYWLNFAGERERYNTLEPGASYTQETWFTHPWVAVDHITGRCYGWILSDNEFKTLEISEDSGGGEGEQQVEATVTDGEDVKADILLACPVSGEQFERHVVAVGVEPADTGEGAASFVIPTTATCPGGEFEISFNDGVNRTAFVDAGEPVIEADPEPPVAAITSPAQGHEFLSSRAVGVWGSGRSEEFGELAGVALDWTVKSAGTPVATATGANPTFVLGAGAYTLELEVTDPGGRTTTVARSFTVLQDADKDGIPLGQETGLPCVAAGATGPPDQDPQNAYKDGDQDGRLNIDEISTGTAPCVKQATYEGISLFVPTTIDLRSTDRTFSAQAMRVDYVDMRHVNRTTVRIVSLAGFDVSGDNAFRNTGFIAFREYAAATFNRQAIIAFLKLKGIPSGGLGSEQVDIVVRGQGSTPISGQPNHNWTFITPGTVRVQK